MIKVSVIVPVYNVEKYLPQCLDSLVSQSLEEIEVIVINDGSTDNCQQIIDEYVTKYPKIIRAFKKENGGIGSARNIGLNVARGEYIGFVDSDDYVDIHMFEKMYDKAVSENGDICVCGFYRKSESDCVEKGTVVKRCFNNNIHKAPELFEENYPYVWNKIIKKELIDNIDIKFAALRVYEDLIFTYTLFIHAEKIVQVANPLYYYRVGRNGAATAAFTEKRFDIFNVADSLIKTFKESGCFDTYYYQVMSIVLRHIYVVLESATSSNLWALKFKFLDMAFEYMEKNFPDWKQQDGFFEKQNKSKKHYTSKKYWYKRLFLKKDKEIYSEGNTSNDCYAYVDFITMNAENVVIEGRYIDEKESAEKAASISIKLNGEEKQRLACYNSSNDTCFKIELAAPKNGQELIIELTVLNENDNILCSKIKYGNFSHLSGIARSYYYNDGYSIVGNKNRMIVRKCGVARHVKHELSYYKALLHVKRFSSLKIIMFRLMYHLYGAIQTKPIWILSDRSSAAKDNGMHLFNYIMKNNINDKAVYFTIDKSSEDYELMKTKGRVLALNSMKYKLMFLRSQVIASSHANRWVINAFGGSEKYYRDLYRFKFVFLQHGVLEHNLSDWLKKTNKNIKLLVTSNRSEYLSIINGNYGYTDKEVKLLGLPRHDNLKNLGKGNKVILFMPTWRKHLTLPEAQSTGLSPYNDKFKVSNYYMFYNSLINDERIIACLKEKGYKGIFVLHPSHISQKNDFCGNDIIEVKREYADYQELFSVGSIMVTDYSSVAIDFSYLKKPIIYTQFDTDEFYAGHLYSGGHYDFKKDGFGEVCKEYEETE